MPKKECKTEAEAKAKKKRYQEQQASISLKIDKLVTSTYGFIANPKETVSHNLVIQFPFQSPFLLSSSPSNLACHNLCTYHQPPEYFQSLLGLGLNFCLTPLHTTGPIDFKWAANQF
jgi:hypothetical protein